MKLFALNFIACMTSSVFASDALFHSSCARTLLTQAFESIKEHHSSEGIALYIQVRDHPNASIGMILQASIELKSYQLREEAIVGFQRIITRSNATESQLLYVGKVLLGMGALELAQTAFDKVLSHPIVSNDTRQYIKDLLK